MNISSIQLMDLTSLRAVLADLRTRIIPSRFEKAYQSDASSLQIGLRTLNGIIWIELSWLAEAPRIVQIHSPNYQGGKSTLAKQFQSSLGHMALSEIKQQGFERIVEIGFAEREGDSIQKKIVLEIMGRHSNLLLLDEKQKVITLSRQVRKHQSRKRPISTGDIYLPPPPIKGIKPSKKESFEGWKEHLSLIPTSLLQALQNTYQGISPSLALQLANDDLQEAQKILSIETTYLPARTWENLFKRWNYWLDQIEKENFGFYINSSTVFSVWNPKNKLNKVKNLSLELGNYYQDRLENKLFKKIKIDFEKDISKYLKNEKLQLKNQEILLEKSKNSSAIQQKADLLFSMLEPSKEIIKEAQKLYEKAKKLKRSTLIIKERIFFHEDRIKAITYTENFLEEIIRCKEEKIPEKISKINELKEELKEMIPNFKNKFQKKKKPKEQIPMPLEIKGKANVPIQVGRNHRQNEWITFKASRPGDIWFHVQECPGSHIVLKASEGITDEADIQMAADIAAFFSRAKGNAIVPVTMVPTEKIKRIPGALPGTVRYKKGSIIWGRPYKGMIFAETSKEVKSSNPKEK